LKIVENKALRLLLLTIGSISFVLGILGLILPVMPGGIFLMVSAACFLRSSEKLYQGLLHHKFFGRFVKEYAETGVISPKLKLIGALTLIMPVVSTIVLYSVKIN
jgi:uncharacterized membrane protein YbaN (DUF454 family)